MNSPARLKIDQARWASSRATRRLSTTCASMMRLNSPGPSPVPADPAHEPAIVVEDLEEGEADNDVAKLCAPAHGRCGAPYCSGAVRVAEADNLGQIEFAVMADSEVAPVDGLVGREVEGFGPQVLGVPRKAVAGEVDSNGLSVPVEGDGTVRVPDREVPVASVKGVNEDVIRLRLPRFHNALPGRLVGCGCGVLVAGGERQ